MGTFAWSAFLAARVADKTGSVEDVRAPTQKYREILRGIKIDALVFPWALTCPRREGPVR